MRIFVTGASGFIGGKICDRLEQLGIEVLCCGRRTTQRSGYFAHDLVKPLPANLGPVDAVIHAAARSSPWGYKQDFVRDNVSATGNVIDFCIANDCPKLVFISSSSIYYRPCHQFNLNEQSAIATRPINHYAATKQDAERLIREYPGPWNILRPRAVFGPNDTVLLPRIIQAARQGKLPHIIASGPPVVGDLIYIDNLVEYAIQAATRRDLGGEFNLTNNQPVEINSFLASVFSQLGIAPPQREVSVRSAMFAAGCLELFHRLFMPSKEPAITRFGVHVFAYSKTFDVSKSLLAFGHPSVLLDEGVERTVEWFKRKW